jgi:hypothetical protein
MATGGFMAPYLLVVGGGCPAIENLSQDDDLGGAAL